MNFVFYSKNKSPHALNLVLNRGMGRALMGSGEAEGRGRASVAAEMSIHNPLLEDSN